MATRVETMFSRAGVLLLLLAGLLAPAAAVGQEPIVPLQFSFSDPGARSMGFGGAFVALADDATAAFANPAGLVQLARPEVSIEFRRWSYSTPFTESGRVEGLPSGFGIDTTVGLTTARSEDDVTGLSFLSVAYPSDRWSVAFFRHLLADFEFSSETQGLFGGGTECCQIRFFDQRVTTDLEFVSYGLSGAYRIGESFDLGLGLIYHESSFTSRTSVFLPDDDSLPSLFALNSYFPDRLLVSRTLFGDDTDWSLIGGFLWRLSNRWSVGGVYRQGPEVRISDEFAAGEAVDLGVPPGGVLFRSADVVQFPQVYGLGLAYRAPEGGLTVSFQWDHIEYSSIVESTGRDDRVLDDADELHLGGEYAFLDSTPIIAVRIGTWLDPDHQIRATSEELPVFSALQRPGDDELHYTAGFGMAWKSFQIDLGVDFAEPVDTVSISAIYSF